MANISRRLVVLDPTTKQKFLIDSGSDISILPKSHCRTPPTTLVLYAANGTTIKTYGYKRLTVSLGLRRDFDWNFCIADVDKPILGSDFLHSYDLLVDIRRSQLIDRTTKLSSKGKQININQVSIFT